MKISENGIVRDMTLEEELNYNGEYNQSRIDELKIQLSNTDYKAIKYAEGWLTAEEYEPVRAERQALRDEINRLEEECKAIVKQHQTTEIQE